MKKLVLGASFALTAALGAAMSPTQGANANPVNNNFQFYTSQATPDSTGDVLVPTDVLTPTLEPVTEAADYYAFVDSFDGQTLFARLPDGTLQPFTIPAGTGGVENFNLNPGDLVAINANKDNVISGLDNPVVETEFVGEVTSYQNGELVATSITGEAKNAVVSEELLSRLDIQPGDEVKITSFENIPGMSSICKVKRAQAQPPAPAPAPQIFTPPPAPAPAIAPVIEGLW